MKFPKYDLFTDYYTVIRNKSFLACALIGKYLEENYLRWSSSYLNINDRNKSSNFYKPKKEI